MALPGSIKQLHKSEDGLSLVNAIILLAILAVFIVLALDTISVYTTWQNVGVVTTDATRLAAQDYNETRLETRIPDTAADYCEANGILYVSAVKNPAYGHNYEITCAKNADTIVFKHIPILKELIYQEVTKDTEYVLQS